MKQYDNTNSGMMLRNENRTKDTQPEFTGSINIEGREFWLSAWVNTGKPGSKIDGKRYFSIKVNPKDAPSNAKFATGQQRKWDDEGFDDEIPF